MSDPLDWLRDVSWTTTIYDVVLQYPITVPATYRVTVIPLDANEAGASPENLQIGFYLKDFVGHAYTIRAINVGGDPTRIIVSDDFLCGDGPQTAQIAYVYESVDQGTSPYLAPINHERLDHSALDYTRAIELAILWRKILAVGTSIDIVIASIDNYEYWRLKGSTGVKTSGLGALYNAFTAASLKGIAPAGYRVPTSDEVLALIGDNGFSAECNELRDTGVIFWTGPNDGTNVSGFTLRGNGFRDKASGTFLGLDVESCLWTITPGEIGDEAMMYIQPADVAPSVVSSPKVDAAGIRLIRDNTDGWVEGEIVVDYDGNEYQTVMIGDQVWITSNLITEHFQDGSKIDIEEDSAKWFALATEGMCYYENDATLGYSEALAEDLRINKHDLLNIQDTDTIKWRIVKISDTEARIVADSTVKPGIPQVQSNWTETDITALDYILNKPTITPQIQSDWDETDDTALDFIKNKPTIPAAQVQANWTEADDTSVDFILNKPTIPAAQIQSNWDETDTAALDFILNKPTIPESPVQSNWTEEDPAALDFIQNKPEIPAAQIQADWTEADSTALDFILNKPTIPAAQIQSDWNETDIAASDFIVNKPIIPDAQVNSDWDSVSGPSEILNKPVFVTTEEVQNYITNNFSDITPDLSTKLISGTIVWDSGLTFTSTELVYKILGQELSAPPTTLTLDAADPTLSRIDIFYVDTFGNLCIAKGTPASSPASPVLLANQLQVMLVLVGPGATEPSGIISDKIYDELAPGEWTPTSSEDTDISIVFNSTDNPESGVIRAQVLIDIPDTAPEKPLHYIGELYQGGVIFYLERGESGTKGLIAAQYDTAINRFWSHLSGYSTYTTGANGTVIGTGQSNTALMLALAASQLCAVKDCNDLVIDGYSDWYMPSLSELSQMRFRRNEIGNFGTKTYWSSSEVTGTYDWEKAWCIAFDSGTSYQRDKNNSYAVRAIRSFDDTTITAGVPVLTYAPLNTNVLFTAAAPVSSSGSVLLLETKSTIEWLPSTRLLIEMCSGSDLIGSVIVGPEYSMFGYNSGEDTWQLIAIPLYLFGPTGDLFDNFRFILTGTWPNQIDFGLDNVRLQSLSSVTPDITSIFEYFKVKVTSAGVPEEITIKSKETLEIENSTNVTWEVIDGKLKASVSVVDGVSSYTYIAYASDATGTGFTNVFDSSLNYIALRTTTTPLTSPVVSDFTGLWKNYKGSDGAPGVTIELRIDSGYIQWRPVGTSTWYNLIATSTLAGAPGSPGSPGAPGAASYTYIAYASDASGTGFTNTFNSALNYIAILTTTSPIATPVASNFTGLWKNYKGADSPDVFDVYINFLALTPFVYDCPYALQFNSQISESTAATISPVLTTAMAQFGKVTVTPTALGLVILKGVLS